MKKTRRFLQIISVMLLCMAMIVGVMTISASADSVVTSVIVDGETLDETNRFLIDTGAGYVADNGELLASYPWVAQFDAVEGVLVLNNYNGGAISTTATGDLTIKLMGENTIKHDAVGIQMAQGGNLTITADAAATLDIQSIPSTSHADEADHYVGIDNNFENGYATTEKSGDSVTIQGYAAVSISSTKTYKSGSVNGIGAYGSVMVLGNASLNITETNAYTSLARGIYSLGGAIVINTTGDVNIAVCGEASYNVGENVFRAASGAVLGRVGKMTLDWTYPEFYEESEVELDAELSSYVIGTIPEDDTSATYGYKFPITVTGGVAKMGDDVVEAAAKGETVTIVADAPEAGQGFYQWSILNEAAITFVDEKAASTTFEMIAGNVELEATYAPAYAITVNKGSANVSGAVSGSVVTVTADAPQKGYQFAGWTVQSGGVVLSNPASSTTSFVVGDAAVEITATYMATPYFITVNGGAASIDDAPVSEASIADIVTLVADTPPAGKVFKEWVIVSGEGTLTDPTATTTTLTGVFGDIEIEATYEDAIYTITVTDGSANVEGAKMGAEITITAAEAAKGYQFAGWTVVSGGVTLANPANATTTFTVVSANVEVKANYTPIEYTIEVTNGQAKIDDTPVTKATIIDTVTLVANTPAAGKVFKEWVIVSGEGTLANATDATTTLTGLFGNLMVQATYEDATYTITVTGGTASAQTAKMGDEITITAEAIAGKTFTSWTLDSGGVTLDSATSATTTFVVGTENVELVANYTFTDYSVSIKDGKGQVDYIDGGITDAHVGDLIYIVADDPESGYAFIRWDVLTGEIELEDPTSYYTIFTMTAGNVELEAVYAEIVVLDKLEFTVTPPAVGAHPTFELVSKDPAKYGSEYVSISLNDSPYTELGAEDTYMLGHSYCLQFQLVLANGYEIDGNTKVYVNGEETSRSLPLWFYYFEFPVSITVINGKAYEDSARTVEITEGLSQYVYLKADEVPEGKVFLGWIVKSGDVTIYSPNYKDSAYFYLKNEPVTVEAVIADVLEEVVLTVTTPKPGDLATIEITSADPSKYTAELIDFYINKSPYTQLTPTDPFEYGRSYTMQFEIIAAEGYAVTEDTVVTVNGDETYGYGGDITGYEKQRWSFELPVSITVINGKAYTSGEYTEELVEFYAPGSLFIKADEAPEGKKFLMWKITTDGDITYNYFDSTNIWVSSASVIVCEAIYAIPINEIELTMPKITVGSTPITTVTTESDLYTVEVETWYNVGDTRTEMLPTDTYVADAVYECRYIITPKDGYCVGNYAEFSVNGKTGNTGGYISGTAKIGAYVRMYDLIPVGIEVTGGKLYLDGVETNETEFLPGTTLTLVADKSLYPEGQTFKTWYIPYPSSNWIKYTDERAESFTFTVGEPSSKDCTVILQAQYATLTSVYYLYTYVPHPVVGGTPSYDAGVDKWKNYFAEVLAWYEGETLLETDHVFEAGKTYTVKIRLESAPGYYFPPLDFEYLRADNTFSGNSADGIFLERGENGEYIIFESSITAKQFQENMSVTVTTPVAGMLPSDVVEKDGDVNCDVEFGGWLLWDEEKGMYVELAEGERFEVGKTYRVDVEFASNDTYFIDYNNITALINGKNPVRFSSGSKDGGLCTVGYYLEFAVEADGSTFDLEVENGSATVDEAPVTEVGGGIVVTITADAPEDGKAFKGWVVVSGESVVFVDATASTTTFVMPAGNVRIQAVYRNIPYTITVVDGEADLSEAGSGETVTVTAGEAPDGKYFAGWECTAGGVTFTDETAKTTTFVMTGEAVTVKAVYADKIVLEEMEFTIPAPAYGENPSYVITSKDPEKYTATVAYWYRNSDSEDLTPESTFAYGEGYTIRFTIAASEKYTFNYSTTILLNGEECGSYGLTGRQYSLFKVPVPITIEGGVAFDTSSNPITAQVNGFYVRLEVGEIPAGKSFSHWEVVSGNVTLYSPTSLDGANFYIGKEPVEIRAIYHTHTYDDTYESNATHHWHECTDPACTDKEGSIKDKVEHTWDNTCDTACNDCGHTRDITHTYSDYIPQKDANCIETGMKAHYECSVCHALFDASFNATTEQALTIAINDSHSFGAWASNGDGTHTRVCSRNNEHTETDDCAGGTATCVAKAICSTCEAAYGNLGAHSYGVKIEEVPTTHTKDTLTQGVKAHFQCGLCAKYFDEGKNPVDYEDLIIPAPTHVYGEWIKDNDNHWKTCECGKKDQLGEHVYDDEADMICNTCSYDRTAPHTHGDGEKVNGQAATCTTDGWKDYYQCSCGHIYTDKDCTNEITSLVDWKAGEGKIAAAHTLGDPVAAVEANCTEKGMQQHRKCSVCGTLFDMEGNVRSAEELSIATNGKHAYGAWASNGDGTHTRICSHNNEHKETVACAGGTATCTEAAVCSTCNTAYGKANGHDYSEATCTKKATCSVCGDETGELKPHDYSEATCTKKATCSVCGGETGDLKPHDYSEATCTKKATCSVCGAETGELKPHDYSEATCAKKATCSVCGAETGDFAAHNYGDKIEAVPATHTKDELLAGMQAHYHCAVCDKYFDVNKNPVEQAALIIPAPTHVWGTWVKNDSTHWKACECGKKDQEGAHVYDNVTDMLCNTCNYDRTAPHTHGDGEKVNGQAATCTIDGWKDYYQCSCGHIYTEKECTNEITNLVAWKAGEGRIAAAHTLGDLIAATEPNCTVEGKKAHYECSVCSTLFDEEKNVKTESELTIPTNGTHAFGAWASNGDGTHTRVCSHNNAHKESEDCAGGTATCTEAAVCSTCNTAYGKANGHDYSEATCTKKATCSVCGDETGELKAHDYSEATCTKKATCSVCGDETGELKAHDYSEATCTAKAKCSVCGDETGELKAHDYSEATCIAKAKCSVCQQETGDLADHKYSEATCTAKAKCSVCQQETGDFAAHKYSEATCTAKAKCSVCQQETGDLADHKYSEATCTAKAKCSVCQQETGDFADHVDANEDGKCDVCQHQMSTIPEQTTPEPEQTTPEPEGTTPEPENPENPDDQPDDPEEPKTGLSGGAIAGIVIGSTAVAGAGGFAVWWFAIQKHTVAELGSACKTVGGKIGGFFKGVFEKIKNLFSKK